jgi:hypothetical protein
MANERLIRDEEWERHNVGLMTLGATLALSLRRYIEDDGASPNRACTFIRSMGFKVTGKAAERILRLVLDDIESGGKLR